MDQSSEILEQDHRYIIGIDLGTTNSAVAYVDLEERGAETGAPRIRFLEVPQLVAPRETAARDILSSFLYLPGPHELPRESTALPWDPARDYVVGAFAREQGALVPGRLVSSAKSWLCHAGVDRTAPILPWGADSTEVAKVSPVAASTRYLAHIREAWNEQIAEDREDFLLEKQMVILTVPASFDEIARELTVSAARDAGIPRLILVEEPLAAFYAWLSSHETDWQEGMQAGQVILVCDVGGGTTDFTIVAIREGEKGLRFDRLAVGDHLMLGGDNMDLALARHLEQELTGQTGKLDTKRWHQLCHRCSKAKESLLGTEDAEARTDITLMGTGGKLIGGTLKGTLQRTQVQQLILEGFFPDVSLEDAPRGGRRAGLTEWGLPYVQDPAVTRHLAAFWQRFRALLSEETGREHLYPDFLLFNGGALTPVSIRSRIREVVGGWFQDVAGPRWAPEELENPRPELAVAVGAAYYGLVRLGEGVRVGAGSPRSYYVEVAGPASEGPDADRALRNAVCLVPRGTEEGFESELTKPAFEVIANQPVAFQLFSSSTRLGDRQGEVVPLPPEEISIFPPIRTLLRFGKKEATRRLPVQLVIKLTEVGTLELWCRSLETTHRWQLQFDVRQEVDPGSTAASAGETLDASLVEKAQEAIRTTFHPGTTAKEHAPERLLKHLMDALEMGREKWPTPAIRKMADTLLEVQAGRALTAQHEARWLNLVGFCLRPGFGDPLDEWRIKQAWKVYLQGLHHPKQVQVRSEWWVFWRRLAAGLSRGQQDQILQEIFPALAGPDAQKKKAGKKVPGKRLNAQEELEVWMALANFELLPVTKKTELGRLLAHRFRKKNPRPQQLWALSRFGARIPFHGSLDRVIPKEEAAAWAQALLARDLPPSEAAGHALVQLARVTGDRERDVPDALREEIARWMEQLPKADRFQELLTNPESSFGQQEQDWVFGEALPAGLVVSS